MRYQPILLQTPAGYALAERAHFFTPACTHLLGLAWDPATTPGTRFSIVRWDRQGAAEIVLGRLYEGHGRVVGNDAGLVVISATRVNDGPTPKPLAFTIGSGLVTDLGAPYPGLTYVNDMNAAGVFVGQSRTLTGTIGFVATVNGMRAVTPPAPAAEVTANGINDGGVVVGTWTPTPGRPARGFVERGGVTEDLGEFEVTRVNNASIAVARRSTDRFAWGTIDLNRRPYELRPLAVPRRCDNIQMASTIDDHGVVGGYCEWTGFASSQGSLLLADASFTVDELIRQPGKAGFLYGHGRSGAISGLLKSGWFLAEPAPEPAANPRAAVRPRLR